VSKYGLLLPADMYFGTYSAGRFVPYPLFCLHYSHEAQQLVGLILVRNAPVFMEVLKRSCFFWLFLKLIPRPYTSRQLTQYNGYVSSL
jgi:hypothetical protein